MSTVGETRVIPSTLERCTPGAAGPCRRAGARPMRSLLNVVLVLCVLAAGASLWVARGGRRRQVAPPGAGAGRSALAHARSPRASGHPQRHPRRRPRQYLQPQRSRDRLRRRTRGQRAPPQLRPHAAGQPQAGRRHRERDRATAGRRGGAEGNGRAGDGGCVLVVGGTTRRCSRRSNRTPRHVTETGSSVLQALYYVSTCRSLSASTMCAALCCGVIAAVASLTCGAPAPRRDR